MPPSQSSRIKAATEKCSVCTGRGGWWNPAGESQLNGRFLDCFECRGTGEKVAVVAARPRLPPQIACGALPDPSGLLAGIIAEPECDARRLIYADWLEEHGDNQTRAKFVRRQVARTPAYLPLTECVPFEGLMRSQPHTLQRKADADGSDIGVRAGGYYVHHCRGFVEWVSCDWAAWAEHGDALRSREWVPLVKLTTVPTVNQEERGAEAFVRIAGRQWHHADSVGLRLGDTISPVLLPLEFPGTAFGLPT